MRALSGIPAPQAAVAAAKIALSLGGNSILCAGYLLKKGDGKKGVRRISSSFPPDHLTPTVIVPLSLYAVHRPQEKSLTAAEPTGVRTEELEATLVSVDKRLPRVLRE